MKFMQLSNVKIGMKQVLVITVPVLSLLGVSIFTVSQQYETSTQMVKLQNLAKFSPSLTNLVHELQKERGASAGFIGSGGKESLGRKVASQRTHTNTLKATFKKVMTGFNKTEYGMEFSGLLDKAMADLSRLDAVRSDVSDLKLNVGGMAKYYTGTITSMLKVVSHMALLSPDAAVTNSIAGYTSFLQAKERAGIERAIGAGGFSRGKFSPKMHQRFVSLIAEQKAFIAVFEQYATPDQRAFYNRQMQASEITKVLEMRKAAIGSAYKDSNLGTISATQWFDTITKKINRLKAVEDKLSTDLVTQAEAIAANANTAFYTLLSIVIMALLLTFTVAFLVGRAIICPIREMACQMQRLAENDMSVDISATTNKDEIGEMARAVLVFKETAIKNHEVEEQKKKERHEREEQRAVMDKITASFSDNIGGIVETVSSASTELNATAQSMTSISEQTSQQASEASATSQQTSNNVQSVATATEEMTSTIGEISQQVAQASNASKQAVEEVGNTSQQMHALEQTANKINEVVELISGIAEQTNLLALNATIESARAGEAGKGFAVVASEVKQLASQTTKATEEISQQISDIQNATKQASGSMESVAEAIDKVDEISTAIAAAMEEQSAATQEIAASVNQAAIGTQQVNDNIESVSETSQEAGTASGHVMSAASELSQQAEMLKGEVDKFIGQVRAG
jgi:methyl-accepting chemotaxis protein